MVKMNFNKMMDDVKYYFYFRKLEKLVCKIDDNFDELLNNDDIEDNALLKIQLLELESKKAVNMIGRISELGNLVDYNDITNLYENATSVNDKIYKTKRRLEFRSNMAI